MKTELATWALVGGLAALTACGGDDNAGADAAASADAAAIPDAAPLPDAAPAPDAEVPPIDPVLSILAGRFAPSPAYAGQPFDCRRHVRAVRERRSR